jgi:hypothetical protein
VHHRAHVRQLVWISMRRAILSVSPVGLPDVIELNPFLPVVSIVFKRARP